jgi:hypothetical protein
MQMRLHVPDIKPRPATLESVASGMLWRQRAVKIVPYIETDRLAGIVRRLKYDAGMLLPPCFADKSGRLLNLEKT